jgi:predicted transglutaminase-like cysteine proteinase
MKRFDNNGILWWVRLNQEKNVDQVFSYDIPDELQKPFTEIEIIMYDYNLLRDDKKIDIGNTIGENTVTLKFNNKENTLDYEGVSEGNQGVLWYNISWEKSQPHEEIFTRKYTWTYDDEDWVLTSEIPVDTYELYSDSNINRSPQNRFNQANAMKKFVTSDDNVISDISGELQYIADNEGYDVLKTANFILRFVQEGIKYALDDDTKGCIEYWRFPVETLVEQQGDCEDTSVLFASIMDYLGYDTALLFYSWKDENGDSVGHLAVGLHLDGIHGSYVLDNEGKKYYYCETTTEDYVVGQLPNNPPEIKSKPGMIVII